jgi:hypothetical protein
MSGTTHFSNFDDSSFAKYENTDSNRLISDDCAIQQKIQDNSKKLKYITTNYVDLLEANKKLNFFSIGVKDQLFAPADKIDDLSNLRNGVDGGQLTSLNERRCIELGQLPVPTMPYRGQLFHGDVNIEDNIRNNIQVKKHSCLPKDTEFYDRSFSIFNNSQEIETPMPSKSVELPESGFQFGRVGLPSRFCNRFK